MTQVRLPYVACYACKVLYTDTGGGTGNMTRHRCPIGASYRSSTHASSTETVEATNSFDSTVSARASGEVRSQLSISMVESGSASLPLITQHSGEVGVSLSCSAPTSELPQMFQNTIGDVDREVLVDAIVKCCALDLIDPMVFDGKGFRGLLKQICNVSKRTSPPVNPELFPDIQTVRSAMQTHLRFCADDLKNELSRTTQGCRLAMETLKYAGREYRVIHGSRISPDWKWRSNILG